MSRPFFRAVLGLSYPGILCFPGHKGTEASVSDAWRRLRDAAQPDEASILEVDRHWWDKQAL